MHILFQRERDGLLEMINVVEHVISAQKELKILSNEFVTRQRAFFTPEGSTLSSSMPREAARQPSNKKNEKVLVSDGTTLYHYSSFVASDSVEVVWIIFLC